ncbi:MAG: CDP-diacylglycerol--serine O-phosphatidyltransferase [Pseudomonadota bacterium]
MATKTHPRKPFFRRKRKNLSPEELSQRADRNRNRINKMKRGIFILPSLLTLGGIFLGFYSMVSAIEQQFVLAAALILIAGVFDGVDGKVARLTHTATRFGLELDSLADVISFGVAPAMLIYLWALPDAGRIGWVSAFVFVACGALRLARFNVQSGSIDPERFNGLPIPAAAAMAATTVLFFDKIGIPPRDHVTLLLITNFVLAFFMVSTVKFHAFKNLTMVKQKPFSSTVAFVLFLALVAASPSIVPFLLCFSYVTSGPILTLVLYLRKRKAVEEPRPAQADALM